ncbi:MAG: DUF1326 domain-containing protein [Phycisphaerae bacterium]|nr:DUF1326 domain-containing protein [Phycisphaerae bacterium]
MLSVILAALLHVSPTVPPVSGEYIEARTASVFAGPCHYNGEVLTTGRDAVMAWSIEHGSWNHVDLSNVRIAAAVSSDANLADASAVHHCEIQIDSFASDAQAKAVVAWLNAHCDQSLGTIQHIRRAPVTFTQDGEHLTFKADGFASADVQGMPNHESCKQPSLVWYSPLIPLEHRLVGYTQQAGYSAATLGDAWNRSDENSAFFGHFSF